jgi:transcriptional regulator with XRE-family HTH domain
MKFDELFDQRSLVAAKLKDCMKERGYTKVSFAKMTDISRPTLDKLLNGTVDNKSTFDKHLNKILGALNISAEELLYHDNIYHDNMSKVESKDYIIDSACDYQMNDKAKKQYELLMDIVGLCEIYY